MVGTINEKSINQSEPLPPADIDGEDEYFIPINAILLYAIIKALNEAKDKSNITNNVSLNITNCFHCSLRYKPMHDHHATCITTIFP
jgi:hypothetical protein